MVQFEILSHYPSPFESKQSRCPSSGLRAASHQTRALLRLRLRDVPVHNGVGRSIGLQAASAYPQRLVAKLADERHLVGYQDDRAPFVLETGDALHAFALECEVAYSQH